MTAQADSIDYNQPISSDNLEQLGILWYSADSKIDPRTMKQGFIMNWDKSSNRGTHWIAVKILEDVPFYFDSLCFPIHPAIQKLFGRGTMYCQNSVRLQLPDDITCGHLCAIFLLTIYNLDQMTEFLRAYMNEDENTDHSTDDILFAIFKS